MALTWRPSRRRPAQRSEMSQLTAALTEALRPAAGDLKLTGT